MQGLQEFKHGIAEIFSDYDSDADMGYVTASTRLEMEIENFSIANVIDMPDEAIDEIFSAFAELHVKAFEKQHISEAEACSIIHQRARDMYEDSRGWRAVEDAIKPYVNKIEGNEAPSQQQWGPQDSSPGWQFDDLGLN